MPELSRFYGLVLQMRFADNKQHNKPHFHVVYGDYKASFAIDGEKLSGKLPGKQTKLIKKWIKIHQEELYKAWNLAVQKQPFDSIEPLD
jgi:hypothetical protein